MICPNCHTGGMTTFYESRNIPVHSCQMLDDASAALAFPRRDLRLGFCASCGFISNVIFEAGVQHYSPGYEEQQSFSPRFRAFQTELIDRLVKQYDIRGKDVIEIGCGKGDFLVELCETGGNRGVGIDPTCDPMRMADRGGGRVRWIPALYSLAHAGLPCDMLCCRHTLEHIHPTGEFIGRMRRVVGDRKDAMIFFEVPDVRRVLKECAFWDIYYEHCSYFTLGSLARVFRANRFDVVELAKDYDDQYLLIVAHPTDEPTGPSLPAEDDLNEIGQAVKTFRTEVRVCLDSWRAKLRACEASGQRVAIWGSGSKCVSFLSAVAGAGKVDAVVDINPHRHGKYLAGSGKRVVSPESLREINPGVVFVMNPIYLDEIQRDLHRMGVEATLEAV